MSDEYEADLVSVVDDEGNRHEFELVDAIETDEGRYVALLPVYENPAENLNDDGELIILEVVEERKRRRSPGPIEDDAVFDDIAGILRNVFPIYMKLKK